MPYADYAFYTDTYKGNAIPSTEFGRLSERATEYIDEQTLDKAKDYTDTDSRLKKACCAVADVYYKYENGGGKSSESVGNYSVTYAVGISNTEPEHQALCSPITRPLGVTGSLYRGL